MGLISRVSSRTYRLYKMGIFPDVTDTRSKWHTPPTKAVPNPYYKNWGYDFEMYPRKGMSFRQFCSELWQINRLRDSKVQRVGMRTGLGLSGFMLIWMAGWGRGISWDHFKVDNHHVEEQMMIEAPRK